MKMIYLKSCSVGWEHEVDDEVVVVEPAREHGVAQIGEYGGESGIRIKEHQDGAQDEDDQEALYRSEQKPPDLSICLKTGSFETPFRDEAPQ